MKKFFLLTILAAFFINLFNFGCARREKEIKIGAILPLTGDLAKFGISFKNGIELAFSENLVDRKVKVLYEDDQGKPEIAVSAFRKLINFHKVPVIIGGVISSTAIAIAPIADNNKVVLLSPTATAPELTKFKFFFRVQPSDFFEGKIMANFAITKLNRPNIAVVYVNNDWGKGLADIFISEYKRAGGNVVLIEYFERGTTDFRSTISKIKSKNPQFVYLLGYLNELLNFLRQASELGLRARFLSAYSFYDPEILKKVPFNIIEGSYVSVPIYDPNSPEDVVKKFVQKYKKKFGQIPDMFAAHSYDCAMLVQQAIQNGNTDGRAIAKYFRQMGEFRGVTGKMKFVDGDVIKPYRIFIVKNGQFKFLQTINPIKKNLCNICNIIS